MTSTPLPTWLDRTEFPFQPTLVDVGSDLRLSVTDVGTGRVLLFSHGTPTWSYEWRHHLRALGTEYRCVAPDHLGFGLSPRPRDADYRPEAHALRFSNLVKRMNLKRYGLVIHDFGGPFALDAALSEPERVERLIVYNTFAWAFGDSPKTKRLANLARGRLFRWLYRNLNLSFVISKSAWGDKRTLTPHTWSPYLQVFPDADSRERVLFALARSMSGSADYCESLWRRLERLASVPVHIIWGMKDSAFPPSAFAKLKSAMPHASSFELPAAGHWPHEEQPDQCLESVRAFLART